MAVDDEVKRQLDAVVGESYTPRRRAREILGKWGAAAILAIAAAALVMWTLHRYMTQAETAPAPKKPVQVRIVPAR
jgi:hypothetical protein